MKIKYKFVSRDPSNKKEISYDQITEDLLREYNIIINSTPLGTFPEVHLKPKLPYRFISKDHLLLDLIYHPVVSSFLKEGINRGAIIKNGLQMLELQAEESWRIWKK